MKRVRKLKPSEVCIGDSIRNMRGRFEEVRQIRWRAEDRGGCETMTIVFLNARRGRIEVHPAYSKWIEVRLP